MDGRISFMVGVVLVVSLPAWAFAVCFDETLLAGYECGEEGRVTVTTNPSKDLTLTATWPVLGGVNGVPLATEGDYVLKLEWTNEADKKVEVRHDWRGFTFDLAGADFIHVDVYVASESAMPEVVGIWDSAWQYKWIDASCEPVRINEWRTISLYVAACNETDLDHIEALVFDKLVGVEGTIYLDNLRLGPGLEENNCRRKIPFSGDTWSVLQSYWPMGAGPNRYTDDPNDVWVDANGQLNMSIINRNSEWYCSEVVGNSNPGHGTYIFTVKGEVDSLDPNMIVGLFIYDVPDEEGNHREIDVELSRWGDADDPNNAQFVVQPWDHPGNVRRFRVGYVGLKETTTYEVTWLPEEIDFRSYYGDAPLRDLEDIIETWSYENVDDIPAAGCENARINFYLMNGEPPAYGQSAEVIIKSFQHVGNVAAYVDIKPDTLNLSGKTRSVTCSIRLGEGYNIMDIDPSCVFLEERVKAEGISVNKRRQVATVTFDGPKVMSLLGERGELGNVRLTVRGQLKDGTRFKGKDTVAVIKKGKGK